MWYIHIFGLVLDWGSAHSGKHKGVLFKLYCSFHRAASQEQCCSRCLSLSRPNIRKTCFFLFSTDHKCDGLKEKCPLQTPIFEHLVLSWQYCLGHLESAPLLEEVLNWGWFWGYIAPTCSSLSLPLLRLKTEMFSFFACYLLYASSSW